MGNLYIKVKNIYSKSQYLLFNLSIQIFCYQISNNKTIT